MKRLLWAGCALGLTAGPAGLVVATWAYPDVPSRPPPWPAEPSQPELVISGFIWAHTIGSVFAAVATAILLRAWVRDGGLTNESMVWLGIMATWLMIGVWWGLMFMALVLSLMHKTGKYL
jgi:hypothetical protein